MCLSAIIWANIKTVYYGNTAEDAAAIGFRDDFIYDFITGNCSDEKVLALHSCEHNAAQITFKKFAVKKDKTIY